MTQTRPITIPKVTVDLVFTINFCFTHDFIPLIFDLLVILFKRITHIMFETKLCPHMFWHQNLSFRFKWVLLACFEPKMNFLLTWFLPLIFHSILEVTVDLFFTIILLNQSFFSSKESIRFFWKKKKKILLTCFDTKISHLGSNDYPQLILDPKWNFGLDLNHNIVLAFWETKSTYFCSKMLYFTHFGPKRTVSISF